MNGRLLAAYRRTEYRAAGAVVRVGRRSAAVDEWLRSLGARHGAFVTAWNPRSRPMPPGWNARMQERLRRAARRQQGVAGEGRWRGWAEGHLLLAGDPRRAAVLGRRFRQNAIVVVTRGGPARLWWLEQRQPDWNSQAGKVARKNKTPGARSGCTVSVIAP